MSVSHHTPSQAEGERDEAETENPWAHHPNPEYTTPSQAEGERDDTPETTEDTADPGDRS